MSTEVQDADLASPARDEGPVVNDFQIIVGTVNGTGSQTANTTLIRALFRMGIPVNGKNIFPSNIQGLPTWFTIRLSKDGYIARREKQEVVVAMNMATVYDDIRQAAPGGICLYPEEWKIKHERDDVIYYPIPVKELVASMDVPSSLRDYVANMAYVGALAALLGIDLTEIEVALDFHFAGKQKPVKLNMDMVQMAYDWSQENHTQASPYIVERMSSTDGMILMDGNSAGALGAVFGGLTFAAWYPITPSTSLIDTVRTYAADMRHDPETGQATYAIVQAEDELAAIGMVLGAGWAGARAMTATSGPGMSLMGEFAGLAYFAEIPSVIWNVQRVGPSTGMPTRTSQGDIMAAYTLGHGDTRHVCLLPSNLAEAFEFGWRALDLADRLQTLVFVMSDLDLGMNLWMSDPFEYPDEPLDRGKVLTADDLDRLEDFGRYKDVDGDGIAYRTLPGTDHPRAAYFARGTGHDEYAVYSEKPEDWLTNMERIMRKFETASQIVPKPVIDESEGVKIGLIAYGTTDPAVVEARDLLRADGIETNYLRLRALPLSQEVLDFIARHDRVYVLENNQDGQVARIIYMEHPELAQQVKSIAKLDGLPLTARWVIESVVEQEQAR